MVTSAGWSGRGAIDDLTARCGSAAATIITEANPTISHVTSKSVGLESIQAIIALGGGSVLDAAKAIAVIAATSSSTLRSHLIGGDPLPQKMVLPSLIAVPTTSGTGSEVTQWGTIWGENGAKHSVSDRQICPEFAILDPCLCLSMPESLTLSTGLDTLSHAMEAVWNKRHTAVTDAMASQAIRMVRTNLELAMKSPDDLEARKAMQAATVVAGLAMGATQTAIAHSISYPFTSKLGVPHGLACSFTLAECARYNGADHPARMIPIAEGLDCLTEDIPDVIENWLQDLGLGSALAAYNLNVQSVDLISDQLINPARAANNIRPVNSSAAKTIARSALESLAKVR